MLPFSITKKPTETKRKNSPNKDENFEFISNFNINEKNLKNKNIINEPLKKKSKLKIMDFSYFNDEDEISNISSQEVVEKVRGIYKKIDLYKDIPSNKELRIKKTKLIQKKSKNQSIFKEGDFCKIISDKFKGGVGKVVFVNELGDFIRVLLYGKDKIMIKNEYLEKINKETYESELYLCMRHKEEKPIVSQSKEISPTLNDCLYSGLCVRISDKKYMGGKYDGESAIIEDVMSIDKCSVITSRGIYLDRISSSMLKPKKPSIDDRAKIIAGPNKGTFVTILDIKGTKAEVAKYDDTWNEELKNMCLYDQK